MPSQGNLAPQMDPIPLPPEQKVQVQTADPRADPNAGPQMPSVYHGGKTGAAAFMADKVLSGWMAGTKIANERKHQKMVDEVSGAKTGLDIIGQNYRAAKESGDPTKIAEAEKALSEAYTDYLNKAEKYAIPDDLGKKKGTGAKIKQGLKRGFGGGDDPNIGLAHSSLEVLRKADPRDMFGPSKREQQESEVADLQVKKMKQEQEGHDRWEKIAQLDQKDRKPEDQKFLDWYEYEKFGKTKNDRMKDDLLGEVMEGKLPSSGPRHDLAVQLGMVRPDVTSTQLRTVMGPNGQPQTQLVAVGPDGKMVGQPQTLPGNDYVAPNQAQLAGQVINAQVNALAKQAEKAHPDWDEKTRYQFALSSVTATTGGGGADWFQKNQEMDVMNRALQAVVKQHTHTYKGESGSPETKYDDLGGALFGMFIAPTGDGRYAWTPNLVPEKHEGWWGIGKGPDTFGAYTKEQLQAYESQGRAELRSELRKQNPKLSDSDIDHMVPPSAFGGGEMKPPPQPGGMTAPPPKTTAASPGMQAPPPHPAGGEDEGAVEMYNIWVPGENRWESRQMGKNRADWLTSQGAKVVKSVPY